MPWDAPTDPDDRAKAAAWFQKRAAVTKADYAKLSAAAKERSFTIGGTIQLRVVQTVLSEIKRAVAHGDSDLDGFKQRLGERLKSGYVDKNATRLRTAFTTTTQIAYGAGRYAELDSESGRSSYPYRAYSIILDHKTSKLCKSLQKFVAASSSFIWRVRWPPLHPHCRTIVIGLTARQARRRGISRSIPLEKPEEGYGTAPDQESLWEPDPSDFDPRAFAEYQRKQTRMRARDVRARRTARKPKT